MPRADPPAEKLGFKAQGGMEGRPGESCSNLIGFRTYIFLKIYGWRSPLSPAARTDKFLIIV